MSISKIMMVVVVAGMLMPPLGDVFAGEKPASPVIRGGRIPADALQACFVASERFRELHQKLARFDVLVEDQGSVWKVVFVPLRNLPEEADLAGGETSAGREVHYYVSKAEQKIERFHYAR